MTGSMMAAVVGGACAGSEITAQLVRLGFDVVVIEQNDLAYGKIEDGLPRWHHKLQTKEMKAIDEKLSQPNVHFLPKCKLGTDLTIEGITDELGIPLVVLANGAWRDRSLPVAGADQVTDDSFLYQNALVYWFNHYHERQYSGPVYRVSPGAVVIGGGLASIDVAKICQFEMVLAALRERGHEVELIELEHHGIFKTLEKRGLDYASLNLEPARLFYRKRIQDMPLVPLGDQPSPAKLAKAEKVREKIVNNACKRYGFEVYPLHSPAELITENGTVQAVDFEKMVYESGRFQKTGERVRVQASQVISSIGSIPEPIKGIPMDGELYSWDNRFTGAVTGRPGVFCVGNAITGRGNIKESGKNARRLGAVVAHSLEEEPLNYEFWFAAQKEEAARHVESFMAYMDQIQAPSEAQKRVTLEKVKALQEARGYNGEYAEWRDAILAAR